MALAICVGLEEGGGVMGRVARRRRSGRPNVFTLMVNVFVMGVKLLVVHCGRVEARGLVATVAVPVVEIDLGGRPVGIGRGRWGGSAQILHWWFEGRRWFERSGLNHSNLFEAGLLQGRSHGLLLLLRWVILGSFSGLLGLPVIQYE
jgi:hypothetical protein